MTNLRTCSRTQCTHLAIATMTFSYQEARAVIGPLSPEPLVGALDLCEEHVRTATVPVGWELVAHQREYHKTAQEVCAASADDGLTALASALSASAPVHTPKDFADSLAHSMPNPWVSHIEIPQQRPQLRVIDGGQNESTCDTADD